MNSAPRQGSPQHGQRRRLKPLSSAWREPSERVLLVLIMKRANSIPHAQDGSIRELAEHHLAQPLVLLYTLVLPLTLQQTMLIYSDLLMVCSIMAWQDLTKPSFPTIQSSSQTVLHPRLPCWRTSTSSLTTFRHSHPRQAPSSFSMSESSTHYTSSATSPSSGSKQTHLFRCQMQEAGPLCPCAFFVLCRMCEFATIFSQFKGMAGGDYAAVSDHLTRELMVIFMESPKAAETILQVYEASKCISEVLAEENPQP